jgi:hypothetical protein
MLADQQTARSTGGGGDGVEPGGAPGAAAGAVERRIEGEQVASVTIRWPPVAASEASPVSGLLSGVPPIDLKQSALPKANIPPAPSVIHKPSPVGAVARPVHCPCVVVGASGVGALPSP